LEKRARRPTFPSARSRALKEHTCEGSMFDEVRDTHRPPSIPHGGAGGRGGDSGPGRVLLCHQGVARAVRRRDAGDHSGDRRRYDTPLSHAARSHESLACGSFGLSRGSVFNPKRPLWLSILRLFFDLGVRKRLWDLHRIDQERKTVASEAYSRRTITDPDQRPSRIIKPQAGLCR